MAARTILWLGDPDLYEVSRPVGSEEVPTLERGAARDLHDTMRAFQAEHGWGRAIAAPQIGVRLRVVAMHVDEPMTFYNPVLDEHDDETVEYWEDCMSFPELMVRIRLPSSCRLTYHDANWNRRSVRLTGDYAALLQHECDHLDGVLATQRAIDDRAITLRRAQPPKDLAWRGAFEPLD